MQKLPLLISSVLLATGALQMKADEVKLTTALTTGETLNLAINADVKATLTWGNGETLSITGNGTVEAIEVKDATLTLTTTKGKLQTLYVQGDKLTAIDLTGAPNLQSLFAADNQLTQLNLSKCTALTTLDVQGNQLSTVTATAATKITDINAAGNSLTRIPVLASSSRPEYYVAADNAITTAPTAAALTKAKTVWLQGNKLSTLSLSASADLRSLAAADNQLTRVTLRDMPLLYDLSLDNNKLTELDLSKGSPTLNYLSAENNSLSSILWDGRTADYVYIAGNNLFYNSFPSVSGLTDYSLGPQGSYDLGTDYYDLNTAIDLSDLIKKNGWGVTITSGATYTFVNSAGETLVSGKDYTLRSSKVTFLTGQTGVTFHMTSSARYGGVEVVTTPFNVSIPQGIESVTATEALTVSPVKGGIRIEAASPTRVTIVAADGRHVYDATVGSGQTIVSQPQGVYIVNGKKLIVS